MITGVPVAASGRSRNKAAWGGAQAAEHLDTPCACSAGRAVPEPEDRQSRAIFRTARCPPFCVCGPPF